MNSDSDFPALKSTISGNSGTFQRQMMSFSSVAATGTKREQPIRSTYPDQEFPALPSTGFRQRTDEELLSFMSSREQNPKMNASAGMMAGSTSIGAFASATSPYSGGSIASSVSNATVSRNLDNTSNSSESNAPKKHSLLGLLDIIRLNSQDKTTVALGLDLTALGLNLNVNEPLYSTFMSPFALEPSLGSDPAFSIPSCYRLDEGIPSLLSRISSFSDESLFYIFYSMPREAAQEASAQTLYLRGWRYHKELRLWLTRDPQTNMYAKGQGFERGVYIFFDPTSWTRVKKEWLLQFDQLEERSAFGEVEKPQTDGTNNILENAMGRLNFNFESPNLNNIEQQQQQNVAATANVWQMQPQL